MNGIEKRRLANMLIDVERNPNFVAVKFGDGWNVHVDPKHVWFGRTLFEALCTMRGEPFESKLEVTTDRPEWHIDDIIARHVLLVQRVAALESSARSESLARPDSYMRGVAAGIAAERERCALIADDMREKIVAWPDISKKIADRIRSGE